MEDAADHPRWSAAAGDHPIVTLRSHMGKRLALGGTPRYDPGDHAMLDTTRLPWPTRWDEVFGRDAPLVMEIGFGNGQFLEQLARSRPEENVLGVEISSPSLERASRRVRRAGLVNVRLVQGAAPLVLQAHCAEASVNQIIINFPDPWPKPAHQRRRLIQNGFLALAATRIRFGGLLDIATDHPDYAAAITACLERSPAFESRTESSFATQDDLRIPTKYERAALSAGRICYYFSWRRNRSPAAGGFPIPKELPMPHVTLRSPLSLAEIAKRFSPADAASGDVHVNLLGCYVTVSGDRLLIEVYINEAPLEQRVGMTVRKRATGELIVGLSKIGFPRSTLGVHFAIRHLSQFLLDLNPDGKLVQSNLKVDGS